MATTTNYSWSTPDDTALVKDGAAAIRSLGTAIDTTVFTNAGAAIAKTIVDAKGDIIAATAADTVSRLAVGSNGQVLAANSTTGTGLEWITPAGGANWSLLNSGGTALTAAATITISGISGKDKIMILFYGASATVNGQFVRVRLNTDTGSNYYAAGPFFTYVADSTNRFTGINSNPSDSILLARQGDSASDTMEGYLFISGCNSAGLKLFHGAGTGLGGSGTASERRSYIPGGYYNSASTISSVSLTTADQNFDAGTVYVYASA